MLITSVEAIIAVRAPFIPSLTGVAPRARSTVAGGDAVPGTAWTVASVWRVIDGWRAARFEKYHQVFEPGAVVRPAEGCRISCWGC